MFLATFLTSLGLTVVYLFFKYIDSLSWGGSDDEGRNDEDGDLPVDPNPDGPTTPTEGPADREVLENYVDSSEVISDDLMTPEKTALL